MNLGSPRNDLPPTYGKHQQADRRSLDSARSRHAEPRNASETFLSPGDDPLPSGLQRLLRRTVDVGLMAVLFVAPLLMGGRHPLGRLVLASIVWTTALAWFALQAIRRREWGVTGAEWILLFAIALVVMQTLPLPPAMQNWLAPFQAQLLPAWSTDATDVSEFGRWNSISLTPERTRQGLCLLFAYATLFVVAYQRMERLEDIERLLKWVAVSAMFMAAIGLIQYLTSNGRFLWVYEHPTRTTSYTVKGTFANQNHFAHFLALGIGPLLWWTQLVNRSRRPTAYRFQATGGRPQSKMATRLGLGLYIGLGVVVLATVLSFSRGGLIATCLATAMVVVFHAHQRLIDRRTAIAGVCFVVAIMLAITIHGSQRLSSRVGSLTVGSFDQVDPGGGRRKIWSAVIEAIPSFTAFGSGVGSHREVYPTFMRTWSEVEYTHAENGYLQILLETGVPGFLLLVSMIGLTGYWLASTLLRSSSCQVVTCASVISACWIVSILHSLIDFVWYIPACMSCGVLLMAAAARLYQSASRTGKNQRKGFATHPMSRMNWAAVNGVVVLVAIASTANQRGPARAAKHWNAYLKLSLADERAVSQRLSADPSLGRQVDQPAANSAGKSLGSTQHETERLRIMKHHLARTLECNPADARAHLRMATTSLRLFEAEQKSSENPMGLWSLRDAAIASQFPTREAQDRWLAVATGAHVQNLYDAVRHARTAVRLCPLQGKAYLHLADLAFLAGKQALRGALIEQSLAVRPYDGAGLYTAGQEALTAGDLQSAARHYRNAFSRGPAIQQQIIVSLTPQIPVEAFVELFAPDVGGMKTLFEFYRANEQRASAEYVGRHYVQQLEQLAKAASGLDAAAQWDSVQSIYGYLQQRPSALMAAQNAVYADPSDFRLRYILATRFSQVERYKDALEQFRWCQRRRPNDAAIRSRVAETEQRVVLAQRQLR